MAKSKLFYERPYVYWSYERLKNNIYQTSMVENGDIAQLYDYGGDIWSNGCLDDPIIIQRKELLEYNGKYHVSISKYSDGVEGIFHVHLCPLILGIKKGTEKVNKKHCLLDDKQMTIDYDGEFITTAMPSLEQLTDAIRRKYAFGGYWSYLLEQKGGYTAFLGTYKDDIQKGNHRGIPRYEEYLSLLKDVYESELKLKKVHTKKQVKKLIERSCFKVSTEIQPELELT